MRLQCEELLNRPEAREEFLCALRVAPTAVRLSIGLSHSLPGHGCVARAARPIYGIFGMRYHLFFKVCGHAATFGRRVHRAPLVWLHQFFHLFQALRGPLRDDIHRIGLRLACHFR